jgi:hypothetical protein
MARWQIKETITIDETMAKSRRYRQGSMVNMETIPVKLVYQSGWFLAQKIGRMASTE